MKSLFLGILLLALAVGGGLSLLASEAPDGLEHTLTEMGADEHRSMIDSPMPDYEIPVIQNKWARKAIAGASGTLAVLGLTILVGWSLRRAHARSSMGDKSASQDS